MTQDISYFEVGYIDETYFVRIAEAESIQSSQFAVSAVIGVIKSAQVTIQSTFSIQANDGARRLVELYAFTNAQLTAAAQRIRTANVSVSGVFTVAANATKSVYVLSQEDAEFDLSANNSRTRNLSAATTAAFSLPEVPGDISRVQSRVTVTVVGNLNG